MDILIYELGKELTNELMKIYKEMLEKIKNQSRRLVEVISNVDIKKHVWKQVKWDIF